MYADVVREALDEPPDLVVVATDAEPLEGDISRLVRLTDPTAAHALVAGLDGVEDQMALLTFAAEHPKLGVIAVSTDLGQAWTVEHRTELVPLAEVSPDGLRLAVRSSVTRKQ